jgi:hypothetical protein
LRLEDTSVSPLWDDATLNELIAEAVRRYGAHFPVEQSVAVAVGSGATSIAVMPALQAERVVRVLDPTGEQVPRMPSMDREPPRASGQIWRWWNGSLVLSLGADGGTWQIDYLGPRIPPGDDITALDVIDGDEEILVLMTAAAALQRRAIEDGKRGLRRGMDAIAATADVFNRDVELRIGARKRRVRDGFIG